MNNLPFSIDNIFPTPGMITSTEEKTLYNINAALSTLIEQNTDIVKLLLDIRTQLDKIAAKKPSESKTTAAKKG